MRSLMRRGDHRAAARQQAVAAEHERAHQPGAVRAEHVDRGRARLQHADVPLVQLRVRAPVLDRAHRGHRVDDLEQRLQRIALAAGERILEDDQRQVARVGDALEVIDRHLRALAEAEHARGENEQRRSTPGLRHARDAGTFEGAFRVDAVDDRQPVADLFLRELEHAPLLVERAGRDFRGVRVGGDCRDPFDRGDVAQMRAVGGLVDGKVFVERQQHRGNDALRNVALVSRLGCASWIGSDEPV
jgi:hypothetical protein